MAASNPYIAGSPVRGRGRFIGRTDVLRDVARMLQNPNANALVLFGQRRIGKTSVLLHIERELGARKDFIPFYFDLQDKATLPLPEVLYRMAQKVSVVTKTPLPKREQFDQDGLFFRDTFIPAVTKTGKHRGIVLLLDEFDVLDIAPQDQIGPTFFIYLRDWMKSAKSVQFIFVLGRRPEELSVNALSTFKSIHSRKVSLMSQEDSKTLVRQSEREGSLSWTDEAVDRVWYWTQGQPYFTQLLCSEIWETIIREEPVNPRPAGVDVVDGVIDDVLERGANALQWIWNSLSPAERIVLAAMAASRGEYISQDELTDILNRSKVRLILRELEVAPETLIRWDLLRPMSTGFRFAVPLLRRWVAAEKPLRMVKAELDNLEPLAENLYRSGEGFFGMGNLDEAERQLRNALNVNPNHFRARLMLGQVLVGQGNPSGAVEELEPAYEFDPPSAKNGLINALLSLAETQNENEQLSTFNRILAIDPGQSEAVRKKQAILRERAELTERNEDLETALRLYQQIDDKASVTRIQRKIRKREIDAQLGQVQKYEEVEDWSSAIAIYQKLLVKYPDEGDWQTRLNEARTQARLAETYSRAVNVMQQGDAKLAQRLFGNILGVQPDYKDAALHLIRTSRGLQGETLVQEIPGMNERPSESPPQPQPEQPNHTAPASSVFDFAPPAETRDYPRYQEDVDYRRYPERSARFDEPERGRYVERPPYYEEPERGRERRRPAYFDEPERSRERRRPAYFDEPERTGYVNRSARPDERLERPERSERFERPERPRRSAQREYSARSASTEQQYYAASVPTSESSKRPERTIQAEPAQYAEYPPSAPGFEQPAQRVQAERPTVAPPPNQTQQRPPAAAPSARPAPAQQAARSRRSGQTARPTPTKQPRRTVSAEAQKRAGQAKRQTPPQQPKRAKAAARKRRQPTAQPARSAPKVSPSTTKRTAAPGKRQAPARAQQRKAPPPAETVELIEPIEPIVPPEITIARTAESGKRLGQEFRFDLLVINERGEEVSHRRGKAYERITDIGGVMLEMVYVPGGTFLMGSPPEEESRANTEEPLHQVTIAPFYMGKFPVTQAQWNLIMQSNPSRFKSSKRPVENVSWKNAVEFCSKLSRKTGGLCRLPSEAEWEYACRAGTTSAFYFGETIMPFLANYDCRRKYASGVQGTFRKKTTNVGGFPPNAFGLYDMHGNVWEWCADPWRNTYHGAPTDGSVWKSESNNPFRVLRGGSWCNDPRDCRSAARDRNEFESWFNNAIGFRVVITASKWKPK